MIVHVSRGVKQGLVLMCEMMLEMMWSVVSGQCSLGDLALSKHSVRVRSALEQFVKWILSTLTLFVLTGDLSTAAILWF